MTGKLFHSGIPQNAINSINLATHAINEIQRRFYEDFPMTDKEKDYLFQVGCTLKPTQIKTAPGSINQIPGKTVICGDVRITPFVEVSAIKKAVEGYVKDFNANVETLPTHGYDRFKVEGAQGSIEWKWLSEGMKGVAVDKTSLAHKALVDAITAVRGKANEFSLTGSLPVIADLKAAGLDVQVTGFGRMDAYHAVDEYALLSELVQGSQVLFKCIATVCQ